MTIETIEIAKLELQHGDILLVRVPPDWTHEQQERAVFAVKEAIKTVDGHVQILIGTTDVEFQIVRKAGS
jgi:hypothetical protein